MPLAFYVTPENIRKPLKFHRKIPATLLKRPATLLKRDSNTGFFL